MHVQTCSQVPYVVNVDAMHLLLNDNVQLQAKLEIKGLNVTRSMHWRTNANLYPPERQLTKASETSFDLEGGAKGQI